ncbi:hypothetical protein E2C01_017454 [Portunus trituberculatus]|uniref:Uncharacterized protein n=1 Tax=Portunus trituberculatus TaxID=210409 RepID=A0A5B7DTR3_PORTR|nr:hypothetical protein [Portunus trituberculatus]
MREETVMSEGQSEGFVDQTAGEWRAGEEVESRAASWREYYWIVMECPSASENRVKQTLWAHDTHEQQHTNLSTQAG